MMIEFSYRRKDVIQALRYHFLSRPEIRVMIIVVNAFALLCAILYHFGKVTPAAVLLGSFTWFVLMTIFWFVMPMAVYRRNETFKDHFQMNFREDGFTLGNERGSRPFAWSKLSKFVETPDFFYLYFDPRTFFLVPKAAFADTGSIQELRHLMQRCIQA